MAKMIKFDLPIDGVKVATLDDLRDHFTTETIGHFRSRLLARWLRSRSMTRELAAVEALTADDDAAVLKELCRIFEVEADDDAIAAAIAEATGVPGIRPDQVRRKRARNPGDTFQDCPECPKLVVVPSHSFMMGSSLGSAFMWLLSAAEEGELGELGELEELEELMGLSEKELEEKLEEEWDGAIKLELAKMTPIHKVRIDYLLAVGMYPVTFDEWDACVSDGGCGGYRPDDEGWGRGALPVINVSWEDAQNYVKWLSWKTGKGYRLLSESEWEYVARAGTRTRYWWGDEIDRNRANCNECGSRWDNKRTASVGSFSANTFGLYDVHGNVQEWVEDCWNDSYDGAPEDGSAWVSEDCDCYQRVLRGGSWSYLPRNLRSTSRNRYATGNRNNFNGFRVARTLTP